MTTTLEITEVLNHEPTDQYPNPAKSIYIDASAPVFCYRCRRGGLDQFIWIGGVEFLPEDVSEDSPPVCICAMCIRELAYLVTEKQ